jgi:alkaline phosphatase
MERAVYDTIMLENAVKLARDWASVRGDDTLILVVADHNHPVGLVRVAKPNPDADRGKQHEGGEALGQFVVAGGHPTGVLGAIEQPLDAVAQGIERFVDGTLYLPAGDAGIMA